MNDSSVSAAPGKPTPFRRASAILIGVGLSGLLIWVGLAYYNAAQSFHRGKRFLQRHQALEAEAELQHFLRWHSSHVEARLLLAEAIVTGSTRNAEEAARLATQALQQIPDSSPLAAEARMREGRLAFLILQKPAEAETRLLISRKLNENLLDTHFLLWKLFDMTERSQHAETHFWNVYRLTPDAGKPERLREWYTSQFSPGAATAELDRRMGFLPPGESPSGATRRNRLAAFMKNEPDSPMVIAANARVLLDIRKREQAAELLLSFSDRESAFRNSFFLSTLIEVMIELGRLDDAGAFFRKWPTQAADYSFWQTAGRIHEIVERDDRSAIKAYGTALEIWPGPAEWTLMHRRAQCLARLGERDSAETARQEARRVELLMELEPLRELRLALLDLKNPSALEKMVDFYKSINRLQEAKCWQTELERLRSTATKL